MTYINVSIDASNLAEHGKDLRETLARPGGGSQPMRNALARAGARYMGFIRQRFTIFSRGGGDWLPLSKATLRARRKGRKSTASSTSRILAARGLSNPGSAAILRDTGLLFNSLTTFESEDIRAGVRVGSGVEYGQYHDQGGRGGRPPQRQIFVDPNEETEAAIQAELERGVQETNDLLGGKPNA